MDLVYFSAVGRVFSTLVYDTSGIYREKPWLIFWPFDTKTGVFTGLAGMSYHGGFIGGLLGLIFWCRKHKANLWKWVDCMSVAIPFGYTFGRIGNFMNGELYGRITTAPWGVIFPRAEKFMEVLDSQLQQLNSDYEAKRYKDITLQKPELVIAPQGTFNLWLKSRGKLGGQHKVPRLANDRKVIEEVLKFVKRS